MSAESSRSLRIDAYAAGLIDGEGCIGATATKTTVGIRVDVGMTTKAQEVLYLLQAEYGGRVGSFREATDRWEKALAWRIFGPEAAAFLRRIEPHVVLKREQVRLALLIEDTRAALPKSATGKRSYWTEEAFARCMTLYRRIKELNRKGPAPVPPPPPPGSQMFAQLVAGSWVVAQTDLFSELGSAPFSGTWPKRGSMRSGACFEHPTWEPPTSGHGSSSLLLTPTSRDGKGGGRANPPPRGTGGKDGSGGLREQVRTLLPTPTARDWKDGDVRHLDVPTNGLLGRTASRLTGATTSPRSGDGSSPSDDPPQPPPTSEAD